MKSGDDLIKRLKEDDKYKKIIEATPEESREHVKAAVEEFLRQMGEGMDALREQLKDPEVRKKFREAMVGKDKGE